jgi:hypothetical protein
MKPIEATRTFANPDREWTALYIREHLRELFEAPKKDYAAVKLIYEIILEEEKQDLARRKVELDERGAELDQKPEQKSLAPVEIKRRVRIALGKETR